MGVLWLDWVAALNRKKERKKERLEGNQIKERMKSQFNCENNRVVPKSNQIKLGKNKGEWDKETILMLGLLLILFEFRKRW